MGSTMTCQCYVLPYDNVAKVCKDYLQQKYAFYLLIGVDELGHPMAYIGQTNDFSVRSTDHKQNYKIANTIPIKEPGLSEDKKNDMELFFDEIKFLTSFYSCKVFEEPTFTKAEEKEHVSLYMRKPKVGIDVSVFYYPVTKTYILKEGSKIRYADLSNGSLEAYRLRSDLKSNPSLTKRSGGLLILLNDVDISSSDRTPSGATCVINGGADQGTTSLMDKDNNTFETLFPKE